jgi:hypothetical protein
LLLQVQVAQQELTNSQSAAIAAVESSARGIEFSLLLQPRNFAESRKPSVILDIFLAARCAPQLRRASANAHARDECRGQRNAP